MTRSQFFRSIFVLSLAVVAGAESLDDGSWRVLGDGLRVAVHEHREHDVGMGRDERVVLLRLADALNDRGVAGRSASTSKLRAASPRINRRMLRRRHQARLPRSVSTSAVP